MNKSFDDFLKQSLAIPVGAPDRAFVVRVQARIALDEHWRVRRRDAVRQLTLEIVAVGAIAGALVWVSRAAAVSDFIALFPAAALCVMLSAFGLLILPLTRLSSPQ